MAETLSEIFRAAQRVVRARLRTHKAALVPVADRPQRAPHGGFTELPSGRRLHARKQAPCLKNTIGVLYGENVKKEEERSAERG